jgi:hypothetical protein
VRRRNNIDHPGPIAIDPASGFKVPHRNLVRQWDGEYVDRRFVDRRNPQDLIRGTTQSAVIINPRPEPTDVFIATNILWEDGLTPIINADGSALMTEGPLGGEGL